MIKSSGMIVPSNERPEAGVSAREDTVHEEFLSMLQRSYHAIYGCVVTLVPDRNDAEDVMQETVIVLWRKFDEYDRSRPFVQWANGVAYNTARSFLRRENYRRGGVALSDGLLRQLSRVRTSCNELLELRQERLRKCLSLLPEEDRELVLVCYRDEVTIAQIAAERQTSPNALYQKLGRIRQRLFECIDRKMKGTA
ncbi:sigma-70 family RNA polymerase sigma factor [Stratiformator vulcanicus]|uniref:ECF RNA polymerase sigma-E factor n=1 Tax=Stratiformator vulcanicus TaxID=2527980 RepID=A0A517R128_9PLAN|nr:sigma-70 family RNA polymerase sigma factor [Stratiformator vulcanicus]QDT37553.1 ECF RNA polymerase sigma-E factor [Stratiformator vulcanicus]